jgi:hypothetical protein
MRVGRIGKYSPKFDKLLTYVLRERGKSFIYFNAVKLFGTDFICDMLRVNGLLEYGEAVHS